MLSVITKKMIQTSIFLLYRFSCCDQPGHFLTHLAPSFLILSDLTLSYPSWWYSPVSISGFISSYFFARSFMVLTFYPFWSWLFILFGPDLSYHDCVVLTFLILCGPILSLAQAQFFVSHVWSFLFHFQVCLTRRWPNCHPPVTYCGVLPLEFIKLTSTVHFFGLQVI